MADSEIHIDGESISDLSHNDIYVAGNEQRSQGMGFNLEAICGGGHTQNKCCVSIVTLDEEDEDKTNFEKSDNNANQNNTM